jgi:putative DNA primase/helicase
MTSVRLGAHDIAAYNGISNDVARLHGARLVSAMEVESGRRLAEAQVKQLTGGDPIATCFLY